MAITAEHWFDPIALQVGPLAIHWYGVMYLIAFAAGWALARVLARRPGSGWSAAQVDDLVFYAGLGVVLGGRIGYVLFYGFEQLVHDPLMLFRIWEGGMSFHGGLLGVLVANWLFGRRHGKGFFEVTDFIAPVVPVGLAAGRIGNFINGELWGKVSDLPWAVRLPCNEPRFWEYCGGARSGYSAPHLPTQLYEAFFEGLVLFVIVWAFASRPRPAMAVSGVFALGYGVFRFGVEFVRLPDVQLGYLAFGWLTMGQVLSLPLIAVGIGFLWWAYRRRPADAQRTASAG